MAMVLEKEERVLRLEEGFCFAMLQGLGDGKVPKPNLHHLLKVPFYVTLSSKYANTHVSLHTCTSFFLVYRNFLNYMSFIFKFGCLRFLYAKSDLMGKIKFKQKKQILKNFF